MSETNDTLVRREWACPLCGERRMDFLVCHDEAKDITANESDVECLMCGTHYRLRLGRDDSDDHGICAVPGCNNPLDDDGVVCHDCGPHYHPCSRCAMPARNGEELCQNCRQKDNNVE